MRELREILGALAGWEPLQILVGQKSPIFLKTRNPTTGLKVVAPCEGKILIDITETMDTLFGAGEEEFGMTRGAPPVPASVEANFEPGSSPHALLMRQSVGSSTEHTFVDERAFLQTIYVTIPLRFSTSIQVGWTMHMELAAS